MNLAAFFDRHVARFRAKDWTAVADDYAYPFAIYFEDRIATFRNRAEIREGLQSYERTLRTFGVARAEPDIGAVSLPRRGRQIVWITWRHFDLGGAVLNEVPIRYYLHRAANGHPQIHMQEYTRIAQAPMVGALSQQFMAA